MSQHAHHTGDAPEPTDGQQHAEGPPPSEAAGVSEEMRLVEALRQGDEQAFASVIDRYHPALLRLAQVYLPDRAAAEEAVQETWVGVLQGIRQFEGRASLKTWIFRILMNRAKTHALREGRSIPFSALAEAGEDDGEPTVDPQRFLPPDHPKWPGHWVSFPQSWEDIPEDRLLSLETRGRIQQAIQALSPSQREVITLRDIEGWSSDEVCNFLNISQANQRVLLHRARAQVRQALENYLKDE
jgi:RNA polymerase sigma-70 factor (ECF subfamily)